MWLAVPFTELCRVVKNFLPLPQNVFCFFWGCVCFRFGSRRGAAAKIFALGFETHHFVVVLTVLKLKIGL